MKLRGIINRKSLSSAGISGGKIPWNEPAFSQRMLDNHLSQQHDWASRRFSVIRQQVEFITHILKDKSARILDLGCGPGFYTQLLAEQGYQCVGVDFSPASIEYAKAQSEKQKLSIDYVLADIRDYENDERFDLVMLTFGEFNVFSRADAEKILAKASSLLSRGGVLLVEVHTFDEVKRQGLMAPTWQRYETGLFSEQAHLLLQENIWNEEQKSAITHYYVIDGESAEVTEYSAMMQAYDEDDYFLMLKEAEINNIVKLTQEQWPTGEIFKDKLYVLTGHKE